MAAKKPAKRSKGPGAKPSVRKVTTAKTVKTKDPAKPAKAARKAAAGSSVTGELPFSRMNYILLIIGVLIIALGFFLMSLDDFVDATQFSVSLYIAPLVVVAGFLEIIYAIMYKTRKEADSQSSPEAANA